MRPAPRTILVPALIAALLPVGPAGARQDLGPVVRVSSISPFVAAERPFQVAVQVINAREATIEQATLRVSIRAPVLSRSQLRGWLGAGVGPAPLATLTTDAAQPIRAGTSAELSVEQPAGGGGPFTRSGVYPVEIATLIDGVDYVSRTAVPQVASTPDARLNVALLIPVTRPIPYREDGTLDPGSIDATEIDVLRQQANAVAARPGIPLTLVPDGWLVDVLADLAAPAAGGGGEPAASPSPGSAAAAVRDAADGALEALRRAAAVVGEVASTTYADTDLTALTIRGLQADVIRHVTSSRRALEAHVRRTPSFRVLVPPRLGLGAQETPALGTLGIETVVLDPALLETPPATPPDFPALRYDLFGPSRPLTIQTGTTRLHALLADPDLRARLGGEEQGILLAQAVIAESASSWLELPSLAGERLLVIAPPATPLPSALEMMLDGLAEAPWVRMRTVSDALEVLPPDPAAVVIPRRRAPDRPYLARAREARDALAVLEAISVEPHPRLAELERLTLLAESASWETSPQTGVGLASQPVETVEAIIRGLRVAERRVTLTSRTGPLPVTLLNDSGFPVRVRVRLDTPRANFPAGRARIVELADQRTIDFEVEARAAGDFPVEVHLEIPDGGRRLTTGRVVVRSTAVSAVALAAVGGGALFLILGSLRRRKRNGRDGKARTGGARAG